MTPLEAHRSVIKNTFGLPFYGMQEEVHANAVRKEFWSALAFMSIDELLPGKLALIHSEVSEALEAHRAGEPLEVIGEELADVVIRCMDVAAALKIDLGAQIVRKHIKNLDRPVKHGKLY